MWRGAYGVAAAFAAIALIAVPHASAQQDRQQSLNPEDVLAPSQMAQPMPAPVSEPGAAAKKRRPVEKRTATEKPRPGSAPEHAPHAAGYKTVIECKGPFAKDFRHARARGELRCTQHDLHA